jgi:hypothetical protein
MTKPARPLLRDFFVATSDVALQTSSTGPAFGRSISRYEVHKRRDVLNQQSLLGYLVLLTQRVIIPTSTPYQPGPNSATSYDNYPAILVNSLNIAVNNGAQVKLAGLFPKTLNSSVSTSTMANDGTNKSRTDEATSGSSYTNVNTFGVAVTAGIFGGGPVGTLTLDYSHSWEHATMQSGTSAVEAGTSQETGASATMSIKDWSSFGSLDDSSVNPTWIFGQSYPWDVIQYNQSSDGSHINLPSFVLERLRDGDMVLPPSQLSQFGLDFTMTASWIVDFPNGVTEDETIEISHTTTSYTASHRVSGGTISASLQSPSDTEQASYNSGSLDMSSYSLIPLNGAGAGNGTAIGFTATPFTYPPSGSDSTFKIVSPANTLQATGSGFDAGMTSTFTTNPAMTLTFKISDYTEEYALHLMHWIGTASGPVKVAWSVNDKWSGVLYIDSAEGAGGQGNISSIDLRNTDFTSISFHDYLVIGTNRIVLDFSPVDSSGSTEYTLFAVAIGPA